MYVVPTMLGSSGVFLFTILDGIFIYADKATRYNASA